MLFVKFMISATTASLLILPFLLAAVAISQWRLASRVAGLQRVISLQQGVASQGTGTMTLVSAPGDDDALPGQDQVTRDTGETVPLPPQPAAGGKVPAKDPFLRKVRRNWMFIAAALSAIFFWPLLLPLLSLIQARLVSQVDSIGQALAPRKDRTIVAEIPETGMPRESAVAEAGAPDPMPLEPHRANWLGNWLSLGIAGLLMVAGYTYGTAGMRRRFGDAPLDPWVQVGVLVGFGFGLMVYGAWTERRLKRRPSQGIAFLPFICAGAGLFLLYSACVALITEGLVQTEDTGHLVFGAMLLVPALAVILSGVKSPLLLILGMTGAAMAPFAVYVPRAELSLYVMLPQFAALALIGLLLERVRLWGGPV
ncbi:MAG: hypothetical protein IOC80_14575 [Rhodobacter sp.]|nr:hypothetical protein [Rhodobacter sp.]MCA3521339.1 hypothetical protein [Rhodobacter sp.]MCA3524119.1 hypothetical protein [Rhodobacter sp.]MCA3525227.1 hypothetical protein [Rhodobacter sp.]MCA3529825.1 hypothetical protein [Rhodobacter sp.]